MIINGYWVINVDSFQVGYYLNFRFFSPFFHRRESISKFISMNYNNFSILYEKSLLYDIFPRRCSRIILCSFGLHYIVFW